MCRSTRRWRPSRSARRLVARPFTSGRNRGGLPTARLEHWPASAIRRVGASVGLRPRALAFFSRLRDYRPDTTRAAMERIVSKPPGHLIGIGLYTLAEAGRLTQVNPAKISRWLRGNETSGKRYDALWHPQTDLGEDGIFLGFRDLQEIRVVAAFIERGLSPQRVRQAIVLARELLSEERPLSTSRFRTDGRSVFVQVVEQDREPKLIDLFKGQFAFHSIIDRSLTNLDYDAAGIPALWWPLGRSKSVVIDPARSFGQPVEAETSIPAAVLAAAAQAEGSPQAAARVWSVPVRAVKRAVAFEHQMSLRKAA